MSGPHFPEPPPPIAPTTTDSPGVPRQDRTIQDAWKQVEKSSGWNNLLETLGTINATLLISLFVYFRDQFYWLVPFVFSVLFLALQILLAISKERARELLKRLKAISDAPAEGASGSTLALALMTLFPTNTNFVVMLLTLVLRLLTAPVDDRLGPDPLSPYPNVAKSTPAELRSIAAKPAQVQVGPIRVETEGAVAKASLHIDAPTPAPVSVPAPAFAMVPVRRPPRPGRGRAGSRSSSSTTSTGSRGSRTARWAAWLGSGRSVASSRRKAGRCWSCTRGTCSLRRS